MTAMGMTQPAGRFFIQFAAGVSHLTIWGQLWTRDQLQPEL